MVEGSSSESRDDEGGELEERSEGCVSEGPGDGWCEQEEDDRDTADDDDLESGGLAFDSRDILRVLLEDFAQVFGHGGRDAVADKDDDHSGERHDEPVAAIISRTQYAASDRVDDIGGDIEDDFGGGEPEKGGREFFHNRDNI